MVSLVSAGLGIGFAPEWTLELPNRAVELKKVRRIDFRIGLAIAWNKIQPPHSGEGHPQEDLRLLATTTAPPSKRAKPCLRHLKAEETLP